MRGREKITMMILLAMVEKLFSFIKINKKRH